MQTLAAVVAIFGYVDVPIVYYSTTWWRTQHPSRVIGGDGDLDPQMWIAVLWNMAAWLAWGVLLAGGDTALNGGGRSRNSTPHYMLWKQALK